MIDEYKIKPVLDKFDIDDDKVVEALTEHFDKFVNTYLRDSDHIRKAAFTEVAAHLLMVLMEAEDDEKSLRTRITDVVDHLVKK